MNTLVPSSKMSNERSKRAALYSSFLPMKTESNGVYKLKKECARESWCIAAHKGTDALMLAYQSMHAIRSFFQG